MIFSGSMTWCTWDILNKIYDIIVPPKENTMSG